MGTAATNWTQCGKNYNADLFGLQPKPQKIRLRNIVCYGHIMMIQGSDCSAMIFILLLCDETLRKWACWYCAGGNYRLRLGITFPICLIGLLTDQVADIWSYILQVEAADFSKAVVKHSISIRGDRSKTDLTSTNQQPRFRRRSVTHSGIFSKFQMNLVSLSAWQNSQRFEGRRCLLP
jgi:hypothetical protein